MCFLQSELGDAFSGNFTLVMQVVFCFTPPPPPHIRIYGGGGGLGCLADQYLLKNFVCGYI
jgi:hypothetical protein